jgi:hypothetical protein
VRLGAAGGDKPDDALMPKHAHARAGLAVGRHHVAPHDVADRQPQLEALAKARVALPRLLFVVVVVLVVVLVLPAVVVVVVVLLLLLLVLLLLLLLLLLHTWCCIWICICCCCCIHNHNRLWVVRRHERARLHAHVGVHAAAHPGHGLAVDLDVRHVQVELDRVRRRRSCAGMLLR